MDWTTYKQLADSPGVWTRWMLEQTLELVQWHGWTEPSAGSEPMAQRIHQVLQGTSIAKPEDHRGSAATDLFALRATALQAQSLLVAIAQAERDGFRTSGTMQRGLGGFAAAWTEYLNYCELESQPMSTASERVLAMIDGWNRRDLDGIVDCFAVDAVYHNIPMEPVHGKEAIREAISGFVAGASAIQWDMLQIAENAAGAVLTERLDKFQMGDKWIEVPVMGTFEVRGDEIIAWRDYFDLAGFQSQIE